MSGGERQRLSLAQAVLRGNRVLLLDEVTAHVDPASEETIRQNIASLIRERGCTVISITHDPDFLKAADHIIELNSGKEH